MLIGTNCLARGPTPLIITELTVGLPPRARLCEILYRIVRLNDCHEETPQLLHILLRKRDVSHAIHTDQSRQHPELVGLGVEINTIINVNLSFHKYFYSICDPTRRQCLPKFTCVL